jgi:hypothetical protein
LAAPHQLRGLFECPILAGEDLYGATLDIKDGQPVTVGANCHITNTGEPNTAFFV